MPSNNTRSFFPARYDGTCEPGSGKSSPVKKNGSGTPTSASGASTPGNDGGAAEDGKSFSKELARLQFFGAGPKMSGMRDVDKQQQTGNTPQKDGSNKTRGNKLNYEYDPVIEK